MRFKAQSISHQNCTEVLLEGVASNQNDLDTLDKMVEDLIKNEQSNLIINLEKVQLLNSTGINSLIKIFTKCRNNGGDMYIVNISDKINQVLLLTKLNTVLNIATSKQEAIAIFE